MHTETPSFELASPSLGQRAGMPAYDFQFQSATRHAVDELLRRLRRAWHGLPAAVRSPSVPAVVATLAIVGLLLAFHQVVRGAVHKGELRRAAVAAQAQALRQCNAMPSLRLRDDCLLALRAAPESLAWQARVGAR